MRARDFCCLALAATHALILPSALRSAESGLFPFTLPIDAPPQGIANVSFLNEGPADKLVTVRDGHFYAGDKPIRFWGVCVIGNACFPSHEQAPLFAERLAASGINQVRVHLIDGGAAPAGLFDPAAKNELRILPEQLDKLDFFIAELKKRGIYVELPVHGYHWRNMQGEAVYAGFDKKKIAPFSSGVPMWSPAFIQAEKDFARAFFRHVNPYTGKAYVEEPCVSTVEIINENGIICAWRGGHMRDAWPAAMVADFQQAWVAFLRTRYSSTEKLRSAWASGAVRGDGKNLLKNGDFAGGTAGWWLQVVKPSAGTVEVLSGQSPDHRPRAVLSSDRRSEPGAFVLLQQGGLAIEKGCRYRLSFRARVAEPANTPVSLGVTVSMNHAPWRAVGLSTSQRLDADWRDVVLNFVGSEDEAAAKLMLSPPAGASRLHLADVKLERASVDGLPEGQSLDAGNVTFPLAPDQGSIRTPAVVTDLVDCLYDIDRRYFDAMRDYLKRELGCIHPVKGTQVNQYSSYFSQAKYDYLDAHGYWQHPHFPRKPWDQVDWSVGNSPMVNDGCRVVVNLAGYRVYGLPYNISEYCHPAPSTYCAEQVPTMASLAALQDWDGVAFHCWQELNYDWHRRAVVRLPADRIDSWFNMARHPVKLVTMPFGALAFRRADVAAAREVTAIGLTLEDEKAALATQRSQAWHAFDVAAARGATWRDVFAHRLGLKLNAGGIPRFVPAEQMRSASDTNQVVLDQRDPNQGVMTVDAPRAKAIIGFGAGRTFELGDVVLQPGPTMQKGFSVITASVVRGKTFGTPGAAILLTATGYVENDGMVWNEDRTSVGNQWGKGPVLCEGVPCQVTLKARKATLWPLDAAGHRQSPIAGQPSEAGVQFTIGPRYKTLWYEIAVE